MKWLKLLLISLLGLSLLFMGCTTENLPPEPPAPGKQGGESDLAGQAFTETLEEFNFADPGESFKISLDALSYEDEELQVEVMGDFVYGKGYIAADDGEWEEFSYEGEVVKDWRKSKAMAELQISKESLPLGKYYLVAYACTDMSEDWDMEGAWDCHDWKWMAHEFWVMCSVDDNCDGDFVCEQGKCVVDDGCETDDECPGNQFCDG